MANDFHVRIRGHFKFEILVRTKTASAIFTGVGFFGWFWCYILSLFRLNHRLFLFVTVPPSASTLS